MVITMAFLCLCSRATSASLDYLTDAQLARARACLPAYRWAARQAGVPVFALAAVHYRESDFREGLLSVRTRRTASSPGGAFMLDRGGKTRAAFRANVRVYEQQVARRFGIWPAPRVRDDFRFACLVAAAELREKARGPLWDRAGRVRREVLADALWGYNGRYRAQRTWRRSAYVANDPRRGVRLRIRVRMDGGLMTYRDPRPGALVVYDELVRRLAPR